MAYVRQVLANKLDLRKIGLQFVPIDQLPAGSRYFQYQQAINGASKVSNEGVIADNRRKNGHDYQLQSEGPHPIDHLRQAA